MQGSRVQFNRTPFSPLRARRRSRRIDCSSTLRPRWDSFVRSGSRDRRQTGDTGLELDWISHPRESRCAWIAGPWRSSGWPTQLTEQSIEGRSPDDPSNCGPVGVKIRQAFAASCLLARPSTLPDDGREGGRECQRGDRSDPLPSRERRPEHGYQDEHDGNHRYARGPEVAVPTSSAHAQNLARAGRSVVLRSPFSGAGGAPRAPHETRATASLVSKEVARALYPSARVLAHAALFPLECQHLMNRNASGRRAMIVGQPRVRWQHGREH